MSCIYQEINSCEKKDILDIFFEYLGDKPTVSSCIRALDRLKREKVKLSEDIASDRGIEKARLTSIYNDLPILCESVELALSLKCVSIRLRYMREALASKRYSSDNTNMQISVSNNNTTPVGLKLIEDCYNARRGRALCI